MEQFSIVSGKPELRFGLLIKEVPPLEPSDVRNGQLALPRGWKQPVKALGRVKNKHPPSLPTPRDVSLVIRQVARITGPINKGPLQLCLHKLA